MIVPLEFEPDDLMHLMGHHGLAALKPMTEAPRDGKPVVVVCLELPTPGVRGTVARVVQQWATNEFIPCDIDDNDRSGCNHDALIEEQCLGWLPLPKQWPVVGDPRPAEKEGTIDV